jgi:SAM-dependent methyltransferase
MLAAGPWAAPLLGSLNLPTVRRPWKRATMRQTWKRRDVRSEPRPPGGGIEVFDTAAARALNDARLAHLASLDLPLTGRSVLEVGAGVGHLTRFFLDRNCRIVATEGRAENANELARRLPEVDVRQADVEESLEHLGSFDVVFCYGLLYHLENPIRALRNMSEVCSDLLLIETQVCDATSQVLLLEDEPTPVNQSLRGFAHRPSPSYLAIALNRIGFDYVYSPTRPPQHEDYQFTWRDSMDTTRDGALLRGVFVASRRELAKPTLVSLLN